MGLARAETIVAGLVDGGLAAATPAAVICAAHTPQQRHAYTTLAGLPDCIAREGLASPALLVIGRCVERVAAQVAATAPAPREQQGYFAQGAVSGG